MLSSFGGSLFFIALSLLPSDGAVYSLSLIAAFFLMQVYFNLFYTTRGALAQSLTGKDNYAKLNGWLEIENQTAAFSAGALAVLLLDIFSIQNIFMVCTFSLIASGFLFARIPEADRQVDKQAFKQEDRKLTFDRGLIFLMVAGNIPFVCVMLLNIVKPIFVADVLLEDAKVLALTSLWYTVGAVGMGALSGWLVKTIGAYKALVLAVIGFVFACAIMIFLPTVAAIYLASVAWGIFNSLARIARQTIAMERIENDKMGRFMALGQKISLSIRATVILSYTGLFLYADYAYSFWYVTLIAATGPIILLLLKFTVFLRKQESL